ncbi:hypothetical protein DFH09DRAFT_1331236 [Mycena vulgaris]|nr:hypothetical protein DFH09DRAFT_1331236 [Mycena vulgaris]
MYALNANGLVNSAKLHHINTVIKARNPHTFILSESKTNTKTGPNLPNDDYNIFEEPGVQAENHHLYKWGMVLGVCRCIQVAQRVQITAAALRGRVVPVNVVLQTNNGQDFFHRIIGAYALWDLGLPTTCDFWPELTKLCQSTKTSWSDFVPYTNHRAVIAKIVYTPPSSTGGTIFPAFNTFLNKAHIKYPTRMEKHRHEDFRTEMDLDIDGTGLYEAHIVDDKTFLSVYDSFTELLILAAEKCYGHVARFTRRSSEQITSPRIEKLVAQLRFIGGAICTIRDTNTPNMTHGARLAYNRLANHYHSEALNGQTFLQYAILEKRKAYRALFAEHIAEIRTRKEKQDRSRITAALMNGSTKHLATPGEFIEMPITVNEPDSDKLVSDPAAVKEITREYWSKLYHHNPPPNIPKPWLTTKSVMAIKDRVQAEPFLWPQKTSLSDFRALLRKGTARPAPGRDQWEKWLIKSLSDRALEVVLKLHNYIVMNLRFLGDIKDMWLTMFHKRGLHTDLSNWRGLLLSNFLTDFPMSWLNFTPRARANTPENHMRLTHVVATQQGVQTRDLMSYLAGIKCWARRHKVTVYALKRDQMKGFNYLSPQGMYDAMEAYGLPPAIIDLDCTAQTDTKCFIHTAHGITEPITITGVTKQGGSLSPIKSTLTTSLRHHYLNDLMSSDPDALIITSGQAQKADPHLPDDLLETRITMAEATDDSYIFAWTLPSLRRSILAMERFQYAYGWLTQWLKSMAYVLEPQTDTIPNSVKFDSVTDILGVNPLIVTTHNVKLIKNELDFLCAKVDNPHARFEELQAFIDDFTFPKFLRRPLITLLRKIVKQNIISKARALLSLQPIKRIDTEDLDKRIKAKIHMESGMPFMPSTDVLTLPIDLHGLDFPSIARINDGITIDGLHRDLNHPIPSYQTLARIMLADWSCSINNCINPIDTGGLTRDFARHSNRVPYRWIVAQKAMTEMLPKLELKRTDLKGILSGDVSLSHILKTFSNYLPTVQCLNGHALKLLRGKGIRQLKDMGE